MSQLAKKNKSGKDKAKLNKVLRKKYQISKDKTNDQQHKNYAAINLKIYDANLYLILMLI